MIIEDSGVDIGIVVGNLERSLTFYMDVLGLGMSRQMHMPRVGRVVFLQAGRSTIKLISPETEPGIAVVRGGLGGGATGLRYLTLHVGNLTEHLERCEAAGHRVVMRPKQYSDSYTLAAVEDPDGNWIELMHRQ